MTNQENPFPQMSNEESLAPNPLVSQEEFLNLDEEQLEAVAGGVGCLGCRSNIPEDVIRTSEGKPARTYVEAMRGWEHAHPTPEARQTATWFPRSVETKGGMFTKGKTFWVKDSIPLPRTPRA